MKNLGNSSSLMLLALLAGMCAWISATPTGRRYARRIGADHSQDHPERGDVPGWVMITLMSAVLVAGLLALAGPALETMFNQAMDQVGK
ncbi:hypothetical protein [Pseudarthrobacter sp. DSP2-3-2b1]|uniref:hypothetical protein n=1 Tax=Pseudarthrobacter sp. DSP2-3-2b1 TaxID=2804661 RepID=UPI003CEBCE4B